MSFFPETLRPNEVTHNVFAVKRVRPHAVRFFGRSGVSEVTRKRGLAGFGALGGDSPVGDESPGVAAARLAGARGQLENAKKQRKLCDNYVVLSFFTAGANNLACMVKWDGAVSYWSDRVSEWEGAVGTAQAMAQAEADAAAYTPVPTPVKTPVKVPVSTPAKTMVTTGSAMTSYGATSAVGGLPTWLKVAGGVVLLGGLAYGVSRYTKR